MSEDFTEAQLTAMLPTVYALKKQRDAAKSTYDKACKPFRDWLDAHPGDFLRDGETGVVAKLQERSGTEELDAITLAAQHPQVFINLGLHGCLRLNPSVWKAIKDMVIEGVDAAGYIHPGKGSVALIIDREEA
jgi:hypothetical protein